VKKLEDKKVLNLADLQEVETVPSTFNTYYKKPFSGDAGVYVVGEIFTIMSGHENKDIHQSYGLRLNHGVIEMIAGQVGPLDVDRAAYGCTDRNRKRVVS